MKPQFINKVQVLRKYANNEPVPDNEKQKLEKSHQWKLFGGSVTYSRSQVYAEVIKYIVANSNLTAKELRGLNYATLGLQEGYLFKTEPKALYLEEFKNAILSNDPDNATRYLGASYQNDTTMCSIIKQLHGQINTNEEHLNKAQAIIEQFKTIKPSIIQTINLINLLKLLSISKLDRHFPSIRQYVYRNILKSNDSNINSEIPNDMLDEFTNNCIDLSISRFGGNINNNNTLSSPLKKLVTDLEALIKSVNTKSEANIILDEKIISDYFNNSLYAASTRQKLNSFNKMQEQLELMVREIYGKSIGSEYFAGYFTTKNMNTSNLNGAAIVDNQPIVCLDISLEVLCRWASNQQLANQSGGKNLLYKEVLKNVSTIAQSIPQRFIVDGKKYNNRLALRVFIESSKIENIPSLTFHNSVINIMRVMLSNSNNTSRFFILCCKNSNSAEGHVLAMEIKSEAGYTVCKLFDPNQPNGHRRLKISHDELNEDNRTTLTEKIVSFFVYSTGTSAYFENEMDSIEFTQDQLRQIYQRKTPEKNSTIESVAILSDTIKSMRSMQNNAMRTEINKIVDKLFPLFNQQYQSIEYNKTLLEIREIVIPFVKDNLAKEFVNLPCELFSFEDDFEAVVDNITTDILREIEKEQQKIEMMHNMIYKSLTSKDVDSLKTIIGFLNHFSRDIPSLIKTLDPNKLYPQNLDANSLSRQDLYNEYKSMFIDAVDNCVDEDINDKSKLTIKDAIKENFPSC